MLSTSALVGIAALLAIVGAGAFMYNRYKQRKAAAEARKSTQDTGGGGTPQQPK